MFLYDYLQNYLSSEGVDYIMTKKKKSPIKRKTYRLDDDLAYRLEVYAKTIRQSENSLVSRYIEEGLRRDINQMTLDEELRLKK